MIKRCLLCVGIVLLAAVGAVLLVPPWRIYLQALLANEPLYEGEPVRYWSYELEHGNEEVRFKAASVLSQIGPAAKDAVPALSKALQDSDEKVSHKAAQALAHIGPDAKEAIPALKEALHSPDPWLSVAAAFALWKIEHQADVVMPVFLEALREKHSITGELAAAGLTAMGPDAKEAIPDLIRMLKDADRSRFSSAVRILGAIGPAAKPALQALKDHLKEPVIINRVLVAEAIYKISGQADLVLPTLIEVLKTKGMERQTAEGRAADLLAAMGPKAKPAVPAILEALKGESDVPLPFVKNPQSSQVRPKIARMIERFARDRRKLEEALKKIDPEAALNAGVQ